MEATIYGLMDPNTHRVRYVGRTTQTPERRLQHHISQAKRGNVRPVYAWLRSLLPTAPVVVILQERVPVERRKAYRGDTGWDTADAAECKWMKRFERSQLLCDIPRHSRTYKSLVNPPNVRAIRRARKG